jgi:low affinity Fe/Cu permease
LIHLKINELISSHEKANNSVMNTNLKTEQEIIDLSKEYIDAELENIEHLKSALKDITSENKK